MSGRVGALTPLPLPLSTTIAPALSPSQIRNPCASATSPYCRIGVPLLQQA
jgi:hypothetical protein